MAKKTFNEKLNYSGDLPKVEKLNPRLAERYKTGTMVIAAPVEYDSFKADTLYWVATSKSLPPT